MMTCHLVSYSLTREEIPRAVDDSNDEVNDSELHGNIGNLDKFSDAKE